MNKPHIQRIDGTWKVRGKLHHGDIQATAQNRVFETA